MTCVLPSSDSLVLIVLLRTVHDIYDSHTENIHTVIVKLNDIYGMLVLLGLGVGGAMIIFTAESLLLVSEYD